MVVHKRTAKAIKKKVRKKAQKVIEQARRSDVLPDIPIWDPAVGTLAWALGIHPYGRAALAAYIALENTEKYWGQAAYGRFIPPDTGTEIDPASPWMIPEGYGAPMRPEMATPRAPTKTKRKISKANRAMKMSYDFYRRKFKGKMTQKKCREIMRKASKMAGKANPHTRSRIGKGGDWIKRHCRKVRKGIWNTTKRTYGR